MKKTILPILLVFYTLNLYSQISNAEKALELIENGYVLESIKCLKEGIVSKNEVWSQFFLAQCYDFGYGVGYDSKQAFLYYKKAAERGLPIAQKCLSNCYKFGKGININTSKADYWEKKSIGKFDQRLLKILQEAYQRGSKKYPQNYACTLGIDNKSDNYKSNDKVDESTNNNQTINNITVVQTISPTNTNISSNETKKDNIPLSDVDLNIPVNDINNENTFAIIFANENYQDVAPVPYAIHDGEIFSEYCKKTLGLPQTNIHFVKDATYNNLRREIKWLADVTNAYQGNLKIIVYYAGHGIPDEKTQMAYLLPVDGIGTDISTGWSLKSFYNELGKINAQSVFVLLDACFSGATRDNKMIASSRGIAIKARPEAISGNLIVFAASTKDNIANAYKEKGHGLFTYYLLKAMQQSSGNITINDLSKFVIENTQKKSIVMNGKIQAPTIKASIKLGNKWENWKIIDPIK